MSCDKLVFDLSQEVEGSPSVFVKKDWVNILDNQNGQYVANQSVIDTSQLSNSNKYMSYREGYLAVPMMLSLMSDKTAGAFSPASAAGTSASAPAVFNISGGASADLAIGLKNWFGQMIHSITIDYNGTTIVQQTQYINMWNSFKLMTTLSWGDVATSGSTMGFYPDDPLAWTFNTLASPDGVGVCNNVNAPIAALPASGVSGQFADYASGNGNLGFVKRQQYITYDPDGVTGLLTAAYATTNTFSTLQSAASASSLWKSYVITKTSSTAAVNGLLQIAIMGTIHLKHLHSFFQQTPLLKGVFMKLTLALNNTSSVITRAAGLSGTMMLVSVANSVGGVNPVMVASSRGTGGEESSSGVISAATAGAGAALTIILSSVDYRITAGMIAVGANVLGGTTILSVTHSATATTITTAGVGNVAAGTFVTTASNYTFLSPTSPPVQSLLGSGGYGISAVGATLTTDISVGSRALSSAVSQASTAATSSYQNVVLYVPAYTFNPTFESAYLSSPIKKITYTDVYQYQIRSVPALGTFNNLLTNGIANIKSVLVIPFYEQETSSSTTAGSLLQVPVWQSPFDPAGTGTTSPLCALTNFNVVVSGQNAIYNTQKYGFEEFIHQLQGVNSVNGNMTDGLTSSLINFTGFEMEYCYYYVDVSRMLPVEESVPKSVQIIGQSLSTRITTLMCFVEYGCEVDIDILTGARV